MKVNLLKLFFSMAVVTIFTVIGVHASVSVPTINQVSGQVMWVDIKLGQMQIKLGQEPGMGQIKDYRITRYQTRVQDPTDKKFLTLDDLRPGENVTLDVVQGQEDKVIERIVAESLDASDFQDATGQLQSIDGQVGTLTIQENVRNGLQEQGIPSTFFFDPNSIVVLKSPSIQPVVLVLRPGDQIKIQFVVRDGKQQAYSITLFPPQQTTTTTVTTTTNTQ